MNRRSPAYRWNILALLASAQAIAYIDRVNIAVVGPQLIKVYHYTPAQVGLLLSIACAQLLRSALEGLSTSNPAIYAAGALGVAIMAALSTVVPSRTAARMDPIVALRYE